MKMFRFLGHLIGFSLRTCAAISINFTSLFWKQLLGTETDLSDLKNIDEYEYNRLQELKENARKSNDEEVSRQNLDEYTRLALDMIFNEAKVQMDEIRKGVLEVTGELLFSILNIRVAKERSFGKETVDVELLKKHTRWHHKESFKEIFWPVLEGFNHEEMRKYLQFICGRGRLPADLT
mmetsp:Transcript_108148/g.149437  ORF Transcript_108148/g.149437 Transcript_108148/m.149437 type:complete len:179 (-) Transcript_108148:133-669(-)